MSFGFDFDLIGNRADVTEKIYIPKRFVVA